MLDFLEGLFWFTLVFGFFGLCGWGGWKLAKGYQLASAKVDIARARKIDEIYTQAAREMDEAEERREYKKRKRQMRREFDAADGNVPPWHRRPIDDDDDDGTRMGVRRR